jgi:hypothetical protein
MVTVDWRENRGRENALRLVTLDLVITQEGKRGPHLWTAVLAMTTEQSQTGQALNRGVPQDLICHH